jgi:drug/metabolite transporter (DMT)-like permease
VSPMVIVTLRWWIVAVVMGLFLWPRIRAEWPMMKPYFGRMILMAGFGFIAFNSLFYIAAYTTTAVNIGIIQGSIPIFVLIGAMLFFQTRTTLAQVIGIFITLVGVALVASKGNLEILLSLSVNPGDGIMLLACLLYSGYTLALRPTSAGVRTGVFCRAVHDRSRHLPTRALV